MNDYGQKRQLTFAQYRAFDLTIFAVLTCVFEAVNQLAINRWFAESEFFALSLTIPLILLVMMRWSGFAAIHAVLAGAVYCFFNGGKFFNYVSFIVGNCCALFLLLFFRLVGKERIRGSWWMTGIYVLLGYFLIELGRAAVSALFGEPFFSVWKGFLGTDLLSAAMGFLILLLLRRLNGMFEDQKHYLFRLQREEREAAHDPYYD